ncbi:hypothetical protein LIER_26807 [Lithospermum erythrorhizon]|uniref:Uncharacterized protein n=1 Tax=Lithospermum erythrorhizon TaxID=34254 RepID=A0AAV3RCY5_LITER
MLDAIRICYGISDAKEYSSKMLGAMCSAYGYRVEGVCLGLCGAEDMDDSSKFGMYNFGISSFGISSN